MDRVEVKVSFYNQLFGIQCDCSDADDERRCMYVCMYVCMYASRIENRAVFKNRNMSSTDDLVILVKVYDVYIRNNLPPE